MFWIFLALIVTPMVEIALFIEVGGWIGLWPTLALVLLTAIAGGLLLRAQGVAALTRLQDSLRAGGDPRGPLADGAMILVAGALLLTPGFFTDAVGFALLTPPIRAALKAWAGPRLAARIVTARGGGPGGDGSRPRRPDQGPIEAEYEDVTDEDEPRRAGDSKWTRTPD